jgi:hypothetical protein
MATPTETNKVKDCVPSPLGPHPGVGAQHQESESHWTPPTPFGPRPGRKPLQGKTTRQMNAINAERRAAELGQHRDVAFLVLNRMLHDAVDEAVKTDPQRFDTFLEKINSDKPKSKVFSYIPDYPVLVPPERQMCIEDVRHRATSENPDDAYQSVAEFLEDVARIAAAARLYHLPRGEGEQAQPAGQYARASIVEDADALVQAVQAAVERQREKLNRWEEATRTEVKFTLASAMRAEGRGYKLVPTCPKIDSSLKGQVIVMRGVGDRGENYWWGKVREFHKKPSEGFNVEVGWGGGINEIRDACLLAAEYVGDNKDQQESMENGWALLRKT